MAETDILRRVNAERRCLPAPPAFLSQGLRQWGRPSAASHKNHGLAHQTREMYTAGQSYGKSKRDICFLGTLAVAAPLPAHHSFGAEDDANQPGPGLDASVTYCTLDDSSLW